MPLSPHSSSKARITCIICAFNEAPRIAVGLRQVSSHPLIDEVIVVDDGSSDSTADVVRQFPGVRLVSHPNNLGKSAAMATGVTAASHAHLLLLDADLKGLTSQDITALISPVIHGKALVSISLRRNSLLIFRAIGLDFVSGERVVPKDLMSEALKEIRALPRFGIEMFMNREIIARRLPVAVTHWPQVTQARKTEKLGYWRGMRAELRMIGDLMRATYPLALISQTVRLLLLRIDHPGAASFRVRILQARYQAN